MTVKTIKHGIRNGTILSYLTMINDKKRNEFYKRNLELRAKDKVVIDVGSGTGILSFYALKAGAKFVYAVEMDKYAAELTEFMLSSNFDKSKFKVINMNVHDENLHKEIDQPLDLFVAELVGPGLFTEGHLDVLGTISKLPNNGLICIPDRLSCDVKVWNDDIIGHYNPRKLTNNKYQLELYNTLDLDYANTLIEFDNIEHDKKKDISRCFPSRLYKFAPKCDYSYKNVVSYTKYQPLDDISFEIQIKQPNSTVAVYNFLSCNDDTYSLCAGGSHEWDVLPTFVIKEPGLYRFFYDCTEFSPMGPCPWVYEKIGE